MSDTHAVLCELHRKLAVKRSEAATKYDDWKQRGEENLADHWLGIYVGLGRAMEVVMDDVHVARVAQATEHAARLAQGGAREALR